MTRLLLGLLLAFMVPMAWSRTAAGETDDAKKLQGTWDVVELVAYGKPVDPKVLKGTKFIFDKDRLTIVPGNDKLEEFVKATFSFKLDPSKNPAHVDLTLLDGASKGTVSPGIYELKDGVLRWCQPDGPKTTTRPAKLESPAKSDLYLVTLKKAP
jgi:uncharacterized protein (TIGR03067 family)